MHKFMVMMDAVQRAAAPRERHLRALVPGLCQLRCHEVVSFVPREHAASARGADRIVEVDEFWIDANILEPALHALRTAYPATPLCRVRERVIFERSIACEAPIRRLSLLQRRSSLTRPAFSAYWLDVHAPLAHCHRHVRRYVQNHVEADGSFGPDAAQFDGIAEFEIADWAGMQADYATPEGTRMREDVAKFAGNVTTCVVRTREKVPAG